MRKVIDSNQLRSPNLKAYLAQSRSNFAVLTDYAAIEAYKGNSLEGIYGSMSILSGFPDQVIILKPTILACAMNGNRSGLQKRLIDQRQTKEFGNYVRGLKAAQAGSIPMQRQLLDLGAEAGLQMNRILIDCGTLAEGISGIAKLYTKDERAIVRNNQGFTREFVDKSMKLILEFAANLFRQHPKVNSVPSYDELPYTFLFRFALCGYLLALDWGAYGGVNEARPRLLQNDQVDVNFAAYATFFDGLLSDDAKCLRIHAKARQWLTSIFQCRLSGN